MQRTVNYDLCQYEGSDKTSYLINYNGDMLKIDTAIKAAKDAADNAQSKANTADGKADANALSISTLDTQINGASGLAADLSHVEGDVTTINALIGNGVPTTTDKTIIGAINELAAEMPSPVTSLAASAITYDNTTSGLTADDVQEALDEINAKIPAGGAVDADDVVYDNTASGLSASNVQDAIDEVNGKFVLSTTEHVVGKNTNGDVVYEKTYTDTGNWSDVHVIDADFNSTYFKKVLSIEGAITLGTGTIGCPMIGSSGGSTNFAAFTIPSGGLQIAISGMTVSEYVVTVRYTKN